MDSEETSPTYPDEWSVPGGEVHTFAPRVHRFCLLIPVINEGQRIVDQLARVQVLNPAVDVIVVDGGSTDGSNEPELQRGLGVRTLLIKRDRGKLGAQLRMGMAYALSQGYDGVITVDGNGKDDVSAVPAFVAALESGADFVQGSRFVRGGQAVNTPVSRHLAITLIHAPVVSLAARKRYTDTTNGFRGHSARLLQDPRIAPFRDVFNSYELLAYLPIRASRLGYECREIPVTRAYPEGEVPTKIHGLWGQIRILRILWAAALHRFDPQTTP